ncbi:MAG: phospholipid carrier-dependent glycosyltransferase [Candidatus Eiseniibacteriota bacterium]
MSRGEIRPPARRFFRVSLACLLLVGLALRLPALSASSTSYRLSEAFSGEEVENVRISTGMLHRHSPNPHAFEYPSLFYYLSLAVESGLESLGLRSWTAYLIGVRSLSLLFGLGTIVLTALIARRIAGDAAGILAATLVTFDHTLIDFSALAKPNAGQLFFLLAAFLALVSLASGSGFRQALWAAALLAMATASKWLGGLGLAGLALAPLLVPAARSSPGWTRFRDSIIQGLHRPTPAWKLFLPPLVFLAVFFACVPYSILSPREFGFGLAQAVTAQSLHRRDLPFWAPAGFLGHSMGSIAGLLAIGALAWAARRMARWDGEAHDRSLLLIVGWVLAYGALTMFVFVRLAGYVDLWVPFVAILTGCAWVGERGLLAGRGWAWLLTIVACFSGFATRGPEALAVARGAARFDSRTASGNWLNAHAEDSDRVLADLGLFVPDRIHGVDWNSWGSPPRVVYDESATWGADPIWPDWTGGHRRLIFENVKWQRPSFLLATRPRWVVTSSDWSEVRAHPGIASESADPDFDRALETGSAGYVVRARFAPSPSPGAWRLLALEGPAGPPREYYGGPRITIFERVR